MYIYHIIIHIFDASFHFITEGAIKFDLRNGHESKDRLFTEWLVKNHGIQGIPATIFYNTSHKVLGEDYIRFCFLKNDESLQKAANIFSDWRFSF